ncbi:poly(A) polymerase gamma-like [Saccoglossus kowalevskii]
MPIVTPAYPQQNSTYNVTLSTKAVLVEEFKQGLSVTEEIHLGKADWAKLFEPTNFFQKYRHYIVLSASATTVEHHLEWIGLVESKIRLLTGNLERNLCITLAHVNPEAFSPMTSSEKIEDKPVLCSMWFIGLSFEKLENMNVDLTYDIQSFTDTVYRLAVSTNMYKEGMKLEAKHVKKKQLGDYLPQSVLKSNKKKSLQPGEGINTPTRETGTSSTSNTPNRTPSSVKKTWLIDDESSNDSSYRESDGTLALKKNTSKTSVQSENGDSKNVGNDMPATTGGGDASLSVSMESKSSSVEGVSPNAGKSVKRPISPSLLQDEPLQKRLKNSEEPQSQDTEIKSVSEDDKLMISPSLLPLSDTPPKQQTIIENTEEQVSI